MPVFSISVYKFGSTILFPVTVTGIQQYLEKQRLLPARLFATVTTTAAVSTPSSTRSLRTGFIDVQCSAVHIRTVQRTNCLIGFARVAHFDKCKTSRLSRVTLCPHVH